MRKIVLVAGCCRAAFGDLASDVSCADEVHAHVQRRVAIDEALIADVDAFGEVMITEDTEIMQEAVSYPTSSEPIISVIMWTCDETKGTNVGLNIENITELKSKDSTKNGPISGGPFMNLNSASDHSTTFRFTVTGDVAPNSHFDLNIYDFDRSLRENETVIFCGDTLPMYNCGAYVSCTEQIGYTDQLGRAHDGTCLVMKAQNRGRECDNVVTDVERDQETSLDDGDQALFLASGCSYEDEDELVNAEDTVAQVQDASHPLQRARMVRLGFTNTKSVDLIFDVSGTHGNEGRNLLFKLEANPYTICTPKPLVTQPIVIPPVCQEGEAKVELKITHSRPYFVEDAEKNKAVGPFQNINLRAASATTFDFSVVGDADEYVLRLFDFDHGKGQREIIAICSEDAQSLPDVECGDRVECTEQDGYTDVFNHTTPGTCKVMKSLDKGWACDNVASDIAHAPGNLAGLHKDDFDKDFLGDSQCASKYSEDSRFTKGETMAQVLDAAHPLQSGRSAVLKFKKVKSFQLVSDVQGDDPEWHGRNLLFRFEANCDKPDPLPGPFPGFKCPKAGTISNVDYEVTPIGAYEPGTSAENGPFGPFTNINVRAASAATFHFDFAVNIPQLSMSIFDFDGSKHNTEVVAFCGGSRPKVVPHSQDVVSLVVQTEVSEYVDILNKKHAGPCTVFEAKEKGLGCDNVATLAGHNESALVGDWPFNIGTADPNDPFLQSAVRTCRTRYKELFWSDYVKPTDTIAEVRDASHPLQIARSVELLFESRSNIEVIFDLRGTNTSAEDRNLLFAFGCQELPAENADGGY